MKNKNIFLFVLIYLFAGCADKDQFANSVVELMKDEQVAGWSDKKIKVKSYVENNKMSNYKTNLKIFNILRIPFDFNEYKVDKEYFKDIKKIAAYIKNDPKTKKVEVIGYTDDTGEYGYNKKLSLKRAKEVAGLLIKFGVNPQKIVIKGMGDKNPLVPNTSLENRKINRRVEIVIKG